MGQRGRLGGSYHTPLGRHTRVSQTARATGYQRRKSLSNAEPLETLKSALPAATEAQHLPVALELGSAAAMSAIHRFEAAPGAQSVQDRILEQEKVQADIQRQQLVEAARKLNAAIEGPGSDLEDF